MSFITQTTIFNLSQAKCTMNDEWESGESLGLFLLPQNKVPLSLSIFTTNTTNSSFATGSFPRNFLPIKLIQAFSVD